MGRILYRTAHCVTCFFVDAPRWDPMTSSRVVWLLVLLSSVAASDESSTWSPLGCMEITFECKCELLQGKKSFSCTNKNLTMTPVNGFFLPEGIQMADLSNNRFPVLRDFAFNQYYPLMLGLDQMLVLNMSRNEIQRIAINAFRYIDNLTTLDISYNNIDRLYPLTFQNMSKLRNLHLDHNMIQTLEEFTFKGLESLKVLDLSHNRLSKISWLAFSFSNDPTLLNLENNRLTTFHTNYIYTPATFNGGINLSNNPIICDCDLHQFFQDTYGIVGLYNLTCSEPIELLDLRFTSLVQNDFKGCKWRFILSKFVNHTVKAIASTTTVLTCNTISGPLFKNWTVVSKVDGQNVSDWPDRFSVTQSETWVNLTITNTQKSDEGEYKCSVLDRVTGTRRASSYKVTLAVEEQDLSPILSKPLDIEEQDSSSILSKPLDIEEQDSSSILSKPLVVEEQDSTSIPSNVTAAEDDEKDNATSATIFSQEPTDNDLTLWLVMSTALFLATFFAAVIFIVVRRRLLRTKKLPEFTYERARDSHLYEDVDALLARLAQRTLPLLPSHEYAKVTAHPQPSASQYVQHAMTFRSPFAIPASSGSLSSVSTLDQSEGDKSSNSLRLLM